jgi:aminoglycoside 3-N-acetyltransferase I
MNYTIKKLSKADLAFAKQLFIFFQEDDGIANPELASDKYLQRLISDANYHVFVALDGAKVIGGVTAYELPMYYGPVNEMFLYEIAVRPGYRRQGIATALIESLKALCGENGVKIIFVGTEKSNLAAKELYLNTGGAMEIIPWFTYTLKPVK